jgi:peptidoglycan/LPS O-acetylase OafA/YrhL
MIKDYLFLGNLIEGRNNNFDFIRFFAATMVLFFHSIVLALSTGVPNDFIYVFTNGQFHLGKMGVAVFFIVSGFLITQSFERNNDIVKFFLNRILRIFPALIVLLLLTVFVLGPLVTVVPLSVYFSSNETYTYLKTVFLHPTYFTLPGVFTKNDDIGVNGSLWTLEFEFLCYIIVGVLGILKILRKEVVLAFLVILFLISHFPHLIGNDYLSSPTTIELVKYFTVGMLFYLFRNYIILHRNIALLCLVLLIASSSFGHFQLAFTFFGTYLVMFLAFTKTNRFHDFAKNGDYSYGMYIYAFPIQQLLVSLIGYKLNVSGLFLFSFPLTLCAAYISWHLIEKRALKLKNYNKQLVDKRKAIKLQS